MISFENTYLSAAPPKIESHELVAHILSNPEIGNLELFRAILPMLPGFIEQYPLVFLNLLSQIKSPDILDILLSHPQVQNPSFLNTSDEEDNTLLHYACKRSNIALVERLVNFNIELNCLNHQKLTPLYYVCSYIKNPDYKDIAYNMAKKLIEHGADMEIPIFSGNTVLYAALSNGRNKMGSSICRLLLDKGANLFHFNEREQNYFIDDCLSSQDLKKFMFSLFEKKEFQDLNDFIEKNSNPLRRSFQKEIKHILDCYHLEEKLSLELSTSSSLVQKTKI